MSALVLIGSAAAPLVASEVSTGNPFAATDYRKIAFTVSAVSTLAYLVTGSSLAGALALGAGGGWAAMKIGSGQKGWP